MIIRRRKQAKKPEEATPQPDRVEEIQKEKPTNPVLAIRAMCMTCMEGSYKRVEDCDTKDCPLHHFRFGKNPFRKKRTLSEEAKKKMAENMAKARKVREERRLKNETS